MCLKVIDNLCAIFWHCRYSPNSDGTLVISGLKSEDSGVYTCTASSPHQLEQRQLQLKVQGLFLLKILRVISCSHQQVAVQYPHWLHKEVLLFQGRELVQLVNPWLFYLKMDVNVFVVCLHAVVQWTWRSPQLQTMSRCLRAAQLFCPVWCQETTSTSAGPGQNWDFLIYFFGLNVENDSTFVVVMMWTEDEREQKSPRC